MDQVKLTRKLSISPPNDLWREVHKYKYEHNFTRIHDAVIELLKKGLEQSKTPQK